MNDPVASRAFVISHTVVIAPPLVPEIKLHLARNSHTIFQAAHDLVAGGLGERPYWAFAWPGGQALSRYILDHPDLVAGRAVLDLGAGSAMAAIAAMRAGATHAIAADVDPLSAAAAGLNADLNSVSLTVTTDDLLGLECDADLIIIGDLVYEPDLQDRVGAFIERHRKRGVPFLYGDRTTARRPPGSFRMLDEYEAPLTPALQDDHIERARVWQL